METFKITYCFIFPNGTREVFDLRFNSETIELIDDNKEKMPDWAKLNFNKCPHCPLYEDKHLYCPLASKIRLVVKFFNGIQSFDPVTVNVITKKRKICADTTAQRGISSLMGLIMATSGCPNTIFFKPMAKFHLPFADENETIYRATSMYMLSQYFKKKNNKEFETSLDGLNQIYKNIQLVNKNIAKRLWSATKSDSTVNAVILLDIYAKTIPDVILESLESLEYLFKDYT